MVTTESALLAAVLAAWAQARDQTGPDGDAHPDVERQREVQLAQLDRWASILEADAAVLDAKRHCHHHPKRGRQHRPGAVSRP